MLGGELDGTEIGTILTSLAENTRAVSDQAPDRSALAGALQAGADNLMNK